MKFSKCHRLILFVNIKTTNYKQMALKKVNTTLRQNETLFITSTATGLKEFLPSFDNRSNWKEALDSSFVEIVVEGN